MTQQASKSKGTRILTQGLPDENLHQPPAAMAALGWLGVIAGIAANIWQMYTTIAATYQMFTGSANPPLDFGNVTFDICFLIAFSFQFALLYLVFRINSRWKKDQAGTSGKKKGATSGYGKAAVEVVQQLGLFAIWVGLAFVIDTLGDYTFIASKTVSADATTSMFLIFLYAVALYSLSTISFARAWEYLWAASAGKDDQERTRGHAPASQPKW